MHLLQLADGSDSTGIHSPARVCQLRTPPISLKLTFFQWKSVPRAPLASSSEAYGDLPLGSWPALVLYLVMYAVCDLQSTSQTRYAKT